MTNIEMRMMETICRQLPRIAKAIEILAENAQPKQNTQPKHCCICGNEILEEYPNNAYPFGKVVGDVCCEKCHIEKVIPERIRLMKGEK